MGLTVITFTRDLNTPSLEDCRRSVAEASFPGVQHKVIECPTMKDFNNKRYEWSTSDDYTAIVDDDDVISNDSLKLCYAAALKHDLDIVFTNEQQRVINCNSTYFSRLNQRLYSDVAQSPSAIHHLVMLRGSKIPREALDIANKYSCAIDWLMHSSTALTGKVLHVPKVCYTWVRRDGQHSVVTSKTFNHHYKNLQNSIKDTWDIPKGKIPQANIEELELFIKENNW